MAQYRNTAVVHNITNKAIAATRYNQVDQCIFLQHPGHIFPCFKKIRRMDRKTIFFQRLTYKAAQSLIGMKRLTSAFQQNSIAAFYTQG